MRTKDVPQTYQDPKTGARNKPERRTGEERGGRAVRALLVKVKGRAGQVISA